MDITTGIARASMDMATARTTLQVQTAVLKEVMDIQQESLATLLQSMGLGRNLDIRG